MSEILMRKNVVVGCPSCHHEDVIRKTGAMLVADGYVGERYIEGMIARDRGFSTAIGNLIAIPHGEKEYKSEILNTGLVVLTYPEGLSWGGEVVKIVIGIAAKGDEHLGILERIVDIFEDESTVDAVVARGDADEIYKLLAGAPA